MQGTSQEIPNPEAQRQALLLRCNEVTGTTSPILSEVMSFFPEQAKLFIKTQEYASKIEGKKDVWYTVRHRERGYGVSGNEIYQAGKWEHLGVKGFTGESLIQEIGEIKQLRGEAGFDKYFGSVERISQILDASEMPKEQMEVWDQMTAKVLEVMKVTPEELGSLRDYVEAQKASDSLQRQAEEMKRQSEKVSTESRQRIEGKHFKK